MDRREPSKVIGQGVTGLERHFMEMTLAAGAGDWRREALTLEVRAVEGTGKETDSSQIQEAVGGLRGRDGVEGA